MPNAPTMRIDQLLRAVLAFSSVRQIPAAYPRSSHDPPRRNCSRHIVASRFSACRTGANDLSLAGRPRWTALLESIRSGAGRGDGGRIGSTRIHRGGPRLSTGASATRQHRPTQLPISRITMSPGRSDGLARAITSGVEAETPAESLTLIAGGVPLSTSRSATVRTLRTPWDPDAPQAHLSQSAIAYPAGSSCPTTPPLVRYSTSARQDRASRGLCDDYRRAFAQVGVASSRDAGIARSFREVAREFARVRFEGNVATASGFRAALDDGMFASDALQLAPHMTIPLSPWIVATHVSQTENLATESDTLVEQLTVALEEIDRAARASGCWN